MRTIELFCGTKSFSKVAKEEGHTTFTYDNNPEFKPDVCMDLVGCWNDLSYCLPNLVSSKQGVVFNTTNTY